jgi:hypothetical protein
MEEKDSSEEKQSGKTGTSDTIVAYLLAGLIAVWVVAYAYFAIRAWIGRP